MDTKNPPNMQTTVKVTN